MPFVHDLSSYTKFESSAVLTSICLFPKSEEKRREYLAIISIRLLMVLERLLNSGIKAEAKSLLLNEYGRLESLRDKYATSGVVYRLFQSPNTKKFIDNILERIYMFSVVGSVLDIVLAENTSVSKASTLYVEAIQERVGCIPFLSENVVDKIFKDECNIRSNIWPEFQNVAHLSAAMIHLSPSRLNMENFALEATIEPFNFSSYYDHGTSSAPATLEGFLGLAEGYRQAGTQYRCAKSPKYLLSEEKTWQIKPFFAPAEILRPPGD